MADKPESGDWEERKVDERRHFQRFRHAQPVRFQHKDPSRFGGCLSRDLSGGGIQVHLNDFIPVDTLLILQIRLADANVVDCTGRVVWVKKDRFGDYYQAGLEFGDDGNLPESRKKICGFFSLTQQC